MGKSVCVYIKQKRNSMGINIVKEVCLSTSKIHKPLYYKVKEIFKYLTDFETEVIINELGSVNFHTKNITYLFSHLEKLSSLLGTKNIKISQNLVYDDNNIPIEIRLSFCCRYVNFKEVAKSLGVKL